MKSLIKKRIKTTPNQTNQAQFTENQNLQQDQLMMPFKPFEGKFNSMKQSKLITNRRQSIFSIKQIHIKSEQRRFKTQVQTDDIYQQDFEDYQQSLEEQQTVQQQNQIVVQSINQQIQNQLSQEYAEFQCYSIQEINFYNSKIIENIKFIRYAMQKYKINARKLRKQEIQLNKLQQLKNKAIDFTYELQLERETINKTDLRKSQVSSIRQASVMLKKSKYKLIKQSHRKANPTIFEQQYLSLDSRQQNYQLQIVRQQLLCKKRQFYNHLEQIKELDVKIKVYEQTLDMFQSKLSLISIESLERRKKQLQEENRLKKIILEKNQIELILQINNISNQLAAIEIESLKISQQNKSITQKVHQYQLARNFTPKNKLSISRYFRKKSITEANELKFSIKIPKTPQTPRAISRFYYNPNKNRNSSNFNSNRN